MPRRIQSDFSGGMVTDNLNDEKSVFQLSMAAASLPLCFTRILALALFVELILEQLPLLETLIITRLLLVAFSQEALLRRKF